MSLFVSRVSCVDRDARRQLMVSIKQLFCWRIMGIIRIRARGVSVFRCLSLFVSGDLRYSLNISMFFQHFRQARLRCAACYGLSWPVFAYDGLSFYGLA